MPRQTGETALKLIYSMPQYE